MQITSFTFNNKPIQAVKLIKYWNNGTADKAGPNHPLDNDSHYCYNKISASK